MDHSWRPRPNQGNNICPTCSVSHFPFCPPLPHPSTYPGPNFEPIRGPFDTGRPGFSNNPDPYHDPGYWSRNPNLPGDFGAVNNGYGDNGSGGGYYSNNANVNDDRSSKRLRVDGSYPGGPYGGEVDANLSKPNSGFGFDGGLRRYPQESQELGNSRAPSKVDMGAWMHHCPEYNMGRREHGSHNHQVGQYGQVGKPSGPEYNMSRSAHESHDHQVGQYGQVGNPSGPGSFSHGGFGHDNYSQLYGYRPPNDGRSFEHMQPNSGGSHYDQRSNMGRPDQFVENRPPLMGESGHMGYGYRSPGHFGGLRQPVDSRPPSVEGYQSFVNQNGPTRPPFEPPHLGKQSGYGNPVLGHLGHVQPPQRFEFQPPLPASPPPPLPMEPPVHWSSDYTSSTAPTKESPSVFPPHIRPPVAVHYPQAPIPDSQVRANTHLDNFNIGHASHGTLQGDSQGLLTTYGQYARGSQSLPSKNNLPDKPKTVDASHLFKRPHRISRPDHFVIILRGLPGSGKSYFAKMLRDLELEYGGNAPRIHSMDDYFMTEVEKTEENESSKSSSRGKKRMTKTVIEYCYEPEMEEAYRSSMLKSFKKTLEEGVYTFVIVDDRNLRVADFAQFWATAKRSGYEAYVLEAPYKDPAGCTARNVHGFTQDEVEKMAARWEEAPSLYLQLDVKSLLHGDDLKESSIKEVDMDTEDEDFDASLSNGVDERQADKTSLAGNLRSDVSPRDESNSSAAVDNRTEEVKVLGQSKWSHNLDEDDDEKIELMKGKPKFLSGLLVKSGKDGKSVHWGDQGGRTGFSIGVAKKANMASLVIGPGEGYNLKSNPLPEDEATSGKSEQTKKHRMFQERLQAERESFKAVFDRRRQRIGGVLPEED